jgi:GTPase SAR1 family protein
MAEKIETRRWSPQMRREHEGEASLVLNIWDFGGQEIMRGTHKFFLTQRSIYLLVLEDRRQDDLSVEPWLSTITSLGGDSPVLIIINKSDEGRHDLELDENRLKRDHRAWSVWYELPASKMTTHELRSQN